MCHWHLKNFPNLPTRGIFTTRQFIKLVSEVVQKMVFEK